MKPPTKCPYCGDPLLNIFPPAEDFSDKHSKYCNRRTDHAIAMIVEDDEVTSLSIGISHKTQLQATWIFNMREIWVIDLSDKDKIITTIPYFEPDLSKYRKLVNKIKTYLVFS
jgi:hypothetical protein